jgi:acyl-CoA synthetase (AMP-forming)/AMP-acid ligase II
MSGLAVPDALARKTIIDLVEEQAARRPNALALTAMSAAGGEQRLSYGQLSWRASKLAAGLQGLGISRGDHVGLMLNNDVGVEACVTMLALHRIGAVVVPVNTRFVPPTKSSMWSTRRAARRSLRCGSSGRCSRASGREYKASSA